MPVVTEPESIESTFARLREREKQRFRDERKGRIPRMDAETLRELCVNNEGYETPELNDNLYAHFQGFQKIEGLEPYYNLKALWLESNGLSRLENLAPLVSLRCLYLSKNLIEKIENLENLRELNTLDLSENRIRRVTGLACLPMLSSLNLSRNLLESREDLAELANCAELSNLDISHNHINDADVLVVLKQIPKLRALRITGNDVVSKTKYFRKVYISSMPHLAFLDRPIFPIERTSVEAWATGGNDAELAAKRAFVDKEHADRKRDLQAFRDWQAQVRERRLQEIEEEKARKLENQQLELEELREEDVDLRGFRGITKQEYIKLTPAERAVWDERIEAAHRDSTRDRYEVLGDGVTKIGAKFWAEEKENEIARGREPPVSLRDQDLEKPLPPPAARGIAEISPALSIVPPPAPSAVNAAPTKPPSPSLLLPPPPPPTSRAASHEETSVTSSCNTPQGSPQDVSLPPSVMTSSSDSASTEPIVFQRDASAFFRDAGDARRSWAQLEQQARESPFLHRPTTLPSMVDQLEHNATTEQEDDGNETMSAACAATSSNSSGFPIRALTRAEILRELLVQQPRPEADATCTNVAALD